MRRSRFPFLSLLSAVLGVGAAVALVALLLGGALLRPAPVRAAPAEARPGPGQLTIAGKDGKPAGLCPLEHTDVTADVAGQLARVTVRQEFANPSTEPIEAVYTFPLPEDAAVDDMTMVIGARTVKGQIKRREEAREIYEAAKARGQAAALLDQERPNLFTQAVANIMPGEKVSVVISYVHLLKYDEGRYEWAFPMVVGPRFVPGGGGYTVPGKRGDPSPQKTIEGDPGATAVVTDAEKITPPITPPGTRAGHDIAVTVNLDAGLPLGEIASVLHRVDVAPSGGGGSAATIRPARRARDPEQRLHPALQHGEPRRPGRPAHLRAGRRPDPRRRDGRGPGGRRERLLHADPAAAARAAPRRSRSEGDGLRH
jgi:Ca-activated chloride channel family protein